MDPQLCTETELSLWLIQSFDLGKDFLGCAYLY